MQVTSNLLNETVRLCYCHIRTTVDKMEFNLPDRTVPRSQPIRRPSHKDTPESSAKSKELNRIRKNTNVTVRMTFPRECLASRSWTVTADQCRTSRTILDSARSEVKQMHPEVDIHIDGRLRGRHVTFNLQQPDPKDQRGWIKVGSHHEIHRWSHDNIDSGNHEGRTLRIEIEIDDIRNSKAECTQKCTAHHQYRRIEDRWTLAAETEEIGEDAVDEKLEWQYASRVQWLKLLLPDELPKLSMQKLKVADRTREDADDNDIDNDNDDGNDAAVEGDGDAMDIDG